MCAAKVIIPDTAIRSSAHRVFLEKACEQITAGNIRQAAIICSLYALQSDPSQKDFAPTRNERLYEALAVMSHAERGAEIFTQTLIESFVKKRREIDRGEIIFVNPTFEITDDTAVVIPNAVVVRLTPYTQERAREWNDLAQQLLQERGVNGLIEHPAVMVHALGLAHWLDVGNLMIELGYVRNRLEFPGTAVDLYDEFGVTPETFCMFTHIKHRGMFDHSKVDGKHLGLEEYLKAYRRIRALMVANVGLNTDPDLDVRLDTIVSPGSWWFDPQLGKVSPHFDWIGEIAGKRIVIGKAHDLAPKQLEFATSSSGTRAKLHAAGEYEPMLTARVITLKEIDSILGMGSE